MQQSTPIAPGRRGVALAIALLLALAAATVADLSAGGSALAAGSLSYKGKTSQKRPISFTVSGTTVTRLTFTIVDKCPGKHIVYVHDSHFPTMPVTNRSFGGKFTAKPPSVATVTVSGHVSGRTVSGTLTDRSRNVQTRRICSGKATFKLRPS